MNKKLLNFVVTFVAMFFGVTAMKAEDRTITLEAKDATGGGTNTLTWDTNEATFTLACSNANLILGNDNNKTFFISLQLNINCTLTWVSKDNRRLENIKSAQFYIQTKKNQPVKISGQSINGTGSYQNAKIDYEAPLGEDGTITIETPTGGNSQCYIQTISLTYTADEVSLSIKENKYGTFVAPFDVTLPKNVIAYKVKSSTADKVSLEQLTLKNNILPADNPVIVKHENGTATTQSYYGVKGTGTVTKNGLLGFYETGTTIADGCYVLQSQSDGVQKFYVVASGNDGALTKSTKNRCCLPAGSIPGAKVLNLVFEEETAVCNIESEATIVGYYSINGSKLAAPQVGVNIVKMSNGSVKKVFVK